MTSIRTDEFACHVCRKIARRKGNEFIYQRGWSGGGDGGHCVLCNHEYCASHAVKPLRTDGLEVCEISHTSYYRNHMNKPNVYPTVERYLASIEEDDDDAEIGSDF